MEKPKVIAFYLPQYHPTPHNDEWWGKGFTEWTNVAKAKKLFPGHYQPKVPSELGFYDLRLPQSRQAQADLAREAGIYGFCYYHYWFSKGHEELDLPFKEVVRRKEPDFPFCLCWANESWHKKFWNKDGSAQKELLAEQLYPGPDDNEAHFYSLLEAFRDPRYIRINGRTLFMIYQPFQFENFPQFKQQWNELAEKNGLPPFYFIAQTFEKNDADKILQLGFDGVNHCYRIDRCFYDSWKKIYRKFFKFLKLFLPVPVVIPFRLAAKDAVADIDFRDNVYATMMPNWDHSPRSNDGGTVISHTSPELFEKHASEILHTAHNKKGDNKIVFLKSWNEWGEGNYMEPDLKHGRGFINALRRAIDKYSD